jgi:antirestriction protein
MELTPQPEQGAPSHGQQEAAVPPPAADESWDERVIREGIEAAIRDGRPIDDRTARYIAGQLHGGQASALYALASSGAVRAEVFDELDRDRTERSAQVRVWLASLTVYAALRGESGPVADWTEHSEAQDRADLMRRISSASVTTLGEIATVHTADADAAEVEPDAYSWGDAAHCPPDEQAHEDQALVPVLADEALNELFNSEVDEEFGDVSDLGWFGLVRRVDQPGGHILKRDENGTHHAWTVETDDALTTQWANITNEYGTFYEQRDAYEQVTGEPEPTSSGMYPRVWVASLADYANGHLHGDWFDATREPAVLELAAKHMLRLGRTVGAEEWGIFDYDSFAGAELGEYESFETVSRIARGIGEHGEAFGHWAGAVGSDSAEQIERFEDHYRGEWESFKAYIEDYLEETEFYRFLDAIPEDMRGYVEVDVEQIARDWACDYHVAELGNGRVAVFDTAG